MRIDFSGIYANISELFWFCWHLIWDFITQVSFGFNVIDISTPEWLPDLTLTLRPKISDYFIFCFVLGFVFMILKWLAGLVGSKLNFFGLIFGGGADWMRPFMKK